MLRAAIHLPTPVVKFIQFRLKPRDLDVLGLFFASRIRTKHSVENYANCSMKRLQWRGKMLPIAKIRVEESAQGTNARKRLRVLEQVDGSSVVQTEFRMQKEGMDNTAHVRMNQTVRVAMIEQNVCERIFADGVAMNIFSIRPDGAFGELSLAV